MAKKRPVGGLSSKEKLASKNPAARAEGQREIANLSPEKRQTAVAGAKELAGRKGYQGLAKQEQIRESTQKEKDFTSKAKKADTRYSQPVTPIQQAKPSLETASSLPAPVETQEAVPSNVVQDLPSFKSPFVDENGVLHEPIPLETSKKIALATVGGIGIGAAAISAATTLVTAGATTAAETIAKAASGQITKKTIQKGIQVNTVTAAKTTSYFARLAKAATSPAFVATTLLGVIGSYPFAGFVKEESLQTLGFGINTAVRNEDVAGAEQALQQTAEVLNPDMWNQIIASVPYANVVQELKTFYEASATKLKIDARSVERLKANLVDFQPSALQTAEEQRQDERFATIREENQQRKLAEEARQDERFANIRAGQADETVEDKERRARQIAGLPGQTVPQR